MSKNTASFHKETLAKGVDIYLGDCADVLPTLGKVDAVVTDPPYGIGDIWVGGSVGGGWEKSNALREDRNKWDNAPPTDELIQLILSKAKEHIFWGGNYFNLPPSRCWLIWTKPERGFSLAEAELAWTNMDALVRVWDNAVNASVPGHGLRSDRDREHPTQKPLRLMEWCIQKLDKNVPVKTILDPYMGSGTTGVAAVNLGHCFIGIEREPRWFELAKKRIKDSLNQPLLFIDKPE